MLCCSCGTVPTPEPRASIRTAGKGGWCACVAPCGPWTPPPGPGRRRCQQMNTGCWPAPMCRAWRSAAASMPAPPCHGRDRRCPCGCWPWQREPPTRSCSKARSSSAQAATSPPRRRPPTERAAPPVAPANPPAWISAPATHLGGCSWCGPGAPSKKPWPASRCWARSSNCPTGATPSTRCCATNCAAASNPTCNSAARLPPCSACW